MIMTCGEKKSFWLVSTFLMHWTTCKKIRISLHVYFMWIDVLQPLESTIQWKWPLVTNQISPKLNIEFSIYVLYTFQFSSFCSSSNFLCQSWWELCSLQFKSFVIICGCREGSLFWGWDLSVIAVISNLRISLYNYM